jgi:hypothetical protein
MLFKRNLVSRIVFGIVVTHPLSVIIQSFSTNEISVLFFEIQKQPQRMEKVALSKEELDTIQPRVRSAIKEVLGFEEESVIAVSMKNLQKGTTQKDLEGILHLF